MEQLTAPVIHILSRLGLGQKLTLLGFLFLPPQWLLAHRYLQLIDDSAIRNDVLLFLGLSTAFTVYILLGYFFAERRVQHEQPAPGSGECAPLQQRARQQLKEHDRTLSRISAATNEVDSAADELSKMSANSAEGAREQEVAVNSIASAVEQMVCSINEIEQQAVSAISDWSDPCPAALPMLRNTQGHRAMIREQLADTTPRTARMECHWPR